MPRKTANPNPARLAQIASLQGGHFSAEQARAAGYTKQNLAYHVTVGRFERVSRGFYRLRDLPAAPNEDIIAAWVKTGANRAVVSHETALALYELSTVRPDKIDLTVPRDRRPAGNRPRFPAVRIHTTALPFRQGEIIRRQGVRVTSPARTIVDVADAGTDPEHIIEAVMQAVERGLVTDNELRASARDRSERVRRLVTRAIEAAKSSATVR